MDDIFCAQCGFKNDIENNYCIRCGSSLKKEIEKPKPLMSQLPQLLSKKTVIEVIENKSSEQGEQVDEKSDIIQSSKIDKDSKNIIIFIICLACLIIFYYFYTKPKANNLSNSNYSRSSNEASTVETGTPLHTQFFDVTLNSAKVSTAVITGNEFSDLKSEDGIVYLILDVTFTNTNTESSGILSGSVLINYNGTDYDIDKSEAMIGAGDGWGAMPLEEINALTSKRTKLVYKISDKITGEAYYHPGGSEDNQLIHIGKIGTQN